MFGAIRSRRGRLIAGFAAWVVSAGTAVASTRCVPPQYLMVCQDRYGLWDPGDGSYSGGVLLRWENKESYRRIRLHIGDTLAGELPGDLEMAFLDHVPIGEHWFTVEGECEGEPPARSSGVAFEVIAATPYVEDPVPPFTCQFDEDLSTILVELELPPDVFKSIEVFRRRDTSPDLIHVMTVAANTTTISVPDSQATDMILLQFFDIDCYGSRYVGCNSACLPVRHVRVCQDRHGEDSRVWVDWLPGQSNYTRFEVSLDGKKVAEVDGWRGLAYVKHVAPGNHRFGVKGFCQERETEEVLADFEVLSETPHQDPIANLQCRFDPVERALDGTWLQGSPPSLFIDVYVDEPDGSRRFVKTIGGHQTRVRVKPVEPESELVLQFFDTDCHGSPLQKCLDDGSVKTDAFLRADATGDGQLNLTDSTISLNYLFLGHAKPLCLDAADANDDGGLDIADPIFTLSFLFSGGPEPPAPGPAACGLDPTADNLQSCLTASCLP